MQRLHLLRLLSALITFLHLEPGFCAELRLFTYQGGYIPKQRLAQFEQDSGVKLTIIEAGDAGEMVNKLILTKAHPFADVVFGIDNTLAPRALAAGVIADYTPRAATRIKAELPEGIVSVSYGYITLNYDKAWFTKHQVPLPSALETLTQPKYKNLLVLENPATSSVGRGFLLATIGHFGEEDAFHFWRKLRANGLKVVNGWSEAYYKEFSYHGGSYPIVVSYATSPLAEMYARRNAATHAPTGNLLLPGAVFRQVEGIALIKGGKHRQAAEKFIEFMRSEPVQYDLQTSMWMYPVNSSVTLTPLLRSMAEPSKHQTPSAAHIEAHSQRWVSRWIRTVLR